MSPAVSEVPRAGAGAESASDGRRARVCLVDADTGFAAFARRVLSAHCEIAAIEDGEVALALLRERPAELVLASASLPRVGGRSWLQRLRADARTRAMPVMLLGEEDEPAGEAQAEDALADDFCLKPLSARELVARVRAHLAYVSVRRDAEARVRESEERFRHVAAHSPLIFWLSEADGRCSFLNERWFEFTGQSPAHALGQGWMDAVHPADQPKLRRDFAEIMHEQRGGRLGYRLRRHDGVYRWMLDTVTPRFLQGRFAGCVGSVIDITDEREEREELERSRRHLEMALHAGRIGTFEWDIPTGQVMCSPELEALYGLAPGAFEKTYRAWLQRIVPEDAAGLEAMLRACFEQRTEEVGYEFRILMPDGTRRWFEGKWRCAFGANGRPRRLAGIQVDIDERKRSELNARFRSSLNEALSLLSDPASILEAGASALGSYLQVDECAFFTMDLTGRPAECEHRWRAENSLLRDPGSISSAWTPDELARAGGQRVAQLDDSRRLASGPAAASFAAGVGAWAIAPFSRDGRWIASLRLVSAQPRIGHAAELALAETVLARVWPLVERSRGERAVAAAEAKIRQTLAERRVELERLVAERTARLQETVAELESFSYSISHDLRAPLRAMTGFGELLEEECGERIGPEGRDYLRRIITASRRMDRLTQDVLVYSRVSRTELPMVPVDLGALVAGIVESYPQFHQTHADVVLRGPFPRVLGNEAALMQCVSNLMSNAVKFVAPGTRPRVEVSAETREGRARLVVVDNGIGIAPEARGKIFGIFERFHRGYEGTGIGLAVVRRAMERMGGSVDFSSEPGKGSRFHLELTLAS